MQPIFITAKTIADAWFQLLYNLFDNSYTQVIQKGSFEKEQYRLQYPGASVYIEMPHVDMVPVIPPALGIDPPTTIEYIRDNYFPLYLLWAEIAEGANETYKYSSRILAEMPKHRHDITTLLGYYAKWVKEKDREEAIEAITRKLSPRGTQLDRIIEMLKETPMTNQAVLEIATPWDLDLCVGKDGKLDPPCLRLIDFKVIPSDDDCEHCGGYKEIEIDDVQGCAQCPECRGIGKKLKLSVSVYFRSWDLWAGFPTNLGGIELLKQYVAAEAGLRNGPMYAYSSGLHIYGYHEEIARIRTMKTKEVKNNG